MDELAPEQQALEMARTLVKRHEGYRRFPYRDSRANLSIGYGCCLTTRGLSEEEADWLLIRDLNRLQGWLSSFPFWASLNATRQAVLIDLGYNLGEAGLDQFTRMLAALDHGDYAGAAAAMLDSEWAHQVGTRATDDAHLLEHGGD